MLGARTQRGRPAPGTSRAAMTRGGPSARWALFLLTAVGAAALVLRLLLIAQSWEANPLVAAPLVDAEFYWNWAGRIAAGRLIDDTPFLGAPLFPYFVGLIRALGGGMPAVYVVQAVLHVLSGLLVGRIGMELAGPRVGVLAAVLFFLMLDPAFYVIRLLNATMQVFLVCALWWACRWALQTTRPVPASALVGVLAGLNVLANPPLLLVLPVLAAWRWLRPGGSVGRWVQALLVLAGGALTIAPATLHNYLVSGEFILVSAHGGLTFYHGNCPGARGGYSKAPGISSIQAQQTEDARRLFRDEHGRDGSWREINDFFFRKGLAHWREDPWRTVRLWATKFYWFLTGSNYAEIYVPALERQAPFGRRLAWSPLSPMLLMPPALVGLVWLSRRWRDHLPELALVAVPLVTCVVFWYSPRYRLPAVPILALAGAWTFGTCIWSPPDRKWAVAATGSVVVAAAVPLLNRTFAFDGIGPALRSHFEYHVGQSLVKLGRLEEAEARFRHALELNPGSPRVKSNLGDVLRQLGRRREALPLLQDAARADPDEASILNNLGIALAEEGRPEEALPHFERAVALDPRRAVFRNALANALATLGRTAEAEREYRAAIEASPQYTSARLNFAVLLESQGRLEEALEQVDAALRAGPGASAAHRRRATLLVKLGRFEDAVTALREAHGRFPADVETTLELAAVLATGPAVTAADAAFAVQLARGVVEGSSKPTAQALDTLAMAQAAAGDFSGAIETGRRAMHAAESTGQSELAASIRQRLDLYGQGRGYTLVPDSSATTRPAGTAAHPSNETGPH